MKKLYILLALSLVTFSSVMAQSTAISSSNALHFDGTDDYLRTQTMPPTTSAYTMMAWVNPEKIGRLYIGCWGSDTASVQWGLRLESQKLSTISGTTIVSANTTIPLNTWAHVAMTVNNDSFKFYVNGQPDGSFTLTPNSSSALNNFTVGALVYNGNPILHFEGSIDEFSLWNTELSQASIETYRQNGVSGSESGLVLHYNFNQGTAEADNTTISTVTDTSSSYTADINGMTLQGASSNFVGWTALSTTDFNFQNISFYPNPARESISISGLKKETSFEIYNTLGAKLQKGTVSNNGKIDVQNLSKGLYFISFEHKALVRFIKE